MGCDAHPYIEVRGKSGRWGLRDNKENWWKLFEREGLTYEQLQERMPAYIRVLGDRHYTMFAAIADVRNGGSDSVTPLFPRRGVPIDVSKATKKLLDENDGDYHSHTYFTLRELMEVDWDSDARVEEVAVFADEFLTFRETGRAESPDPSWGVRYREGFREGFHRAVTMEEMTLLLLTNKPRQLVRRRKGQRSGPYVLTTMPLTYRQIVPDLVDIIPELHKLGAPDNVRVVIAFDN